jgi:sugar transferase EpsL
MGQSGREFYQRKLAFSRAVDQFDTVFRTVTSRPESVLACKRVFDIAIAVAALVVLWPVLALVAVAVRLTMGSPVLFRQVRPGWREHSFAILKFRTMRHACTRDGRPLPDDQRLTRLGRFLRSTSLDELPQIWNVLKGDMSIVGPRPLLPEYLPRYNDRQRRRHEVKPGITGWTQVKGRNALTWEQKLDLDVWYVDHRSLWIDLQILAATFWHVIGRKGISQPGHATMPEFLGIQETP